MMRYVTPGDEFATLSVKWVKNKETGKVKWIIGYNATVNDVECVIIVKNPRRYTLEVITKDEFDSKYEALSNQELKDFRAKYRGVSYVPDENE